MKAWLCWGIGASLVACGGKLFSNGGDDDLSTTTFEDGGLTKADATLGDSSTAINDWSCLGHVAAQSPFKTSLSWQVKPVNVSTGATFNGLAVQACASNDGTCASPIATSSTTASGTATLSIATGPNGFDGFWQTQPPGDLLNLYFNNRPIVDDVQVDDRQTWSAEVFQVVLGSAGGNWDETKGVVGFQIHDCNSRYLRQDQVLEDDGDTSVKALAAGVSLAIDPPSAGIILGYFDGDTVSTTQGQTDSSGEGGFVNVPEGWVTITATLVATQQTIGSARLYSKAGAISSVVLSPSP